MTTEAEDKKFAEHLAYVNKYWMSFYDRLDELIKEDGLQITLPTGNLTISEEMREVGIQHTAHRNSTIKRHISSTHVWAPGKMRWSKARDNWFMYPIQCQICHIGASAHEELGFAGSIHNKIILANGDLPSRDMHGNPMHRTCRDVQDASVASLHKRRGKKCWQCGTYGCMEDNY